MISADAQTAVTFSLSPGNAGDAPEGRKLLNTLENSGWDGVNVIMDKAYEGDETRQLVFDLGMEPVVPPKSNRVAPWNYSEAIYRKRNEIERLFRRLKGFRRIFSRFEKLDVMFTFFILASLISDTLVNVNRP
jgi:transposase